MIGTFKAGDVVEDSVGPVPQRDGSLGPIATPQARWCTLGGDVVAGAPAVTAAASGNRTKVTTTAPATAGKYRVEFYGTSANGAGVSMEGTACAECEVTASGLVSATVPAGQCADATMLASLLGGGWPIAITQDRSIGPFAYMVGALGARPAYWDRTNYYFYVGGSWYRGPTLGNIATADATMPGEVITGVWTQLPNPPGGDAFTLYAVPLPTDAAAALAAYGAAKTSDLPAIFAAMGLDPLAVGTVGTVTGLAFTVSGYTGTIPASGTIRLNGQQVSYTFAAGSITLAAGFVGVPSGAWIVAAAAGNTSVSSVSPADIAAIQNGLARPADLRITIQGTTATGG